MPSNTSQAILWRGDPGRDLKAERDGGHYKMSLSEKSHPLRWKDAHANVPGSPDGRIRKASIDNQCDAVKEKVQDTDQGDPVNSTNDQHPLEAPAPTRL